MPAVDQPEPSANDALRSPARALLWWGLPLVFGWSADVLKLPRPAETLVWAFALAWMGLGCTLNARRCHRLHCYVAAPILFASAGAVALVGLGVTPLSPQASSYVVNGALGLALLSFAAEPLFGKYVRR